MELKKKRPELYFAGFSEDWILSKIGDIGDVKMCKRIFSKQTKDKGDIPFYKIGTFGKKADSFITYELYQEYLEKFSFPKKGDILISASGTIGRTVVYDGEPAYFQDSNIVWVNNDEAKILNEFLYYVYKNISFESEGGTIQRLYNNIILNAKFYYPTSNKVQNLVLGFFKNIDELISKHQMKYERLVTLKKSMLEKMFPKKGQTVPEIRFKGFEGEWVSLEFHKTCWFQEGPGLRHWQFTTSGIKVINVTNLVNGFLSLEKTDRHISLDEFQKMYKHFEIQENDIVVASSGNSYGKVSVVRNCDLPLMMNTSVIRFKPFSNLDYDYLLTFLTSRYFKNQIDLLITGGAQPNFGPVHLNEIKIHMPPTINEQANVGSYFLTLERLISNNQKQIEKLSNFKKSLSEKMFV